MADIEESFYENFCYKPPSFNRLVPYRDAYLDLSPPNEYSTYSEPESALQEKAVNKFVTKILVNQAASIAENKDYHEDFETNYLQYDAETIPDMYKIQSKKFPTDGLPKKRGTKSHRRSRSRRSADSVDDDNNDLPEGSILSQTDGQPMVSMTVDMLRFYHGPPTFKYERYMYTEVEGRVSYIHGFYNRQWEWIHKEKLQSCADLIQEKKRVLKLLSEKDVQARVILNLREKVRQLEEKVNVAQDAKRRKRQARRQRKCEAPTTSQSDTGSRTHVESHVETIDQSCDKPVHDPNALVAENVSKSYDDVKNGTDDASRQEDGVTNDIDDISKQEEVTTLDTDDITWYEDQMIHDVDDMSKQYAGMTLDTDDATQQEDGLTYDIDDKSKQEDDTTLDTADVCTFHLDMSRRETSTLDTEDVSERKGDVTHSLFDETIQEEGLTPDTDVTSKHEAGATQEVSDFIDRAQDDVQTSVEADDDINVDDQDMETRNVTDESTKRENATAKETKLNEDVGREIDTGKMLENLLNDLRENTNKMTKRAG